MVRCRGAAAVAAPVACRAAPRGRARRAGRARAVPSGLAARGRRSAAAARRGVDGVLRRRRAVAGCPVPASALESLVLPAGSRTTRPADLDELTATGEVLWVGHGSLPGNDGWVSLLLADIAPLSLPDHGELRARRCTTRQSLPRWRAAGASSSASCPTPGAADDRRSRRAVGPGVGRPRHNDTLAPLRALLGRWPRQPHRVRAARPPRAAVRPRGRPTCPCRSGPPTAAGRWSLLPERETDPTRRAARLAEACSIATAWSPAAR